jgi:two-component system OmpR family sensor kinase
MTALSAPTKKKLAPRKLLPRTLRGKLIAGLVALLTAACAAVGVVTYLAVQGSLARELNSQLQTATRLAYNCWQQPDNDSGDPQPTASARTGTGQASVGDTSVAGPGTPVHTAGYTDSPSGSPTTDAPMSDCQGLGENTFVAYVANGTWKCKLIGPDTSMTLTKGDEQTLLNITPVLISQPLPTQTRYLSTAHGSYELTAVREPGDGTVITGLSLSPLHDTLREVALAEAAVFSVVLVLAGVLGTLWVRLSLRPLRRVAATASAVAELPLESGEVSLPVGVPDTDPGTETGQVGLAFNRMLGHVENALQRRAASEARLRRFAADASHELRTPLAAIRGYAELALLRPGEAPEPVTHALGRVLSESRRMSVLVDDLLLLARLDAGRPLSREPVDMTRLAIDASSDAQAARPGHRWVLELPDDPVSVLGDEGRLRQVLGNLLSNAGRHTPDGTTVTLRLSDTLADGDAGAVAADSVTAGSGTDTVARGTVPPEPRLVVSVTDDGPGIPPALLPDLFERFTRADTSRSHVADATSTGLGLAIVDAVVAAHSGAILLTSRPGMTRFTIVLSALAADA